MKKVLMLAAIFGIAAEAALCGVSAGFTTPSGCLVGGWAGWAVVFWHFPGLLVSEAIFPEQQQLANLFLYASGATQFFVMALGPIWFWREYYGKNAG